MTPTAWPSRPPRHACPASCARSPGASASARPSSGRTGTPPRPGWRSLLRRPEGTGRGTARDRGHEQMLASYLQRYCTKNDTIGFFGPVGWGRLGERGGAIERAPRPGAARRAAGLLRGLGDRRARRPARGGRGDRAPGWLPGARPSCGGRAASTSPPAARSSSSARSPRALFAACDGTRPARELVRELSTILPCRSAPRRPLRHAGGPHAKGVVNWGFQIPLVARPPRRALRELLARGRGRAAARARPGPPRRHGRGARRRRPRHRLAGELDRALDGLEERFPRRPAGRPPAARTARSTPGARWSTRSAAATSTSSWAPASSPSSPPLSR